MNVMTPEHEKWEEFCKILEGKEYCNFRKGEYGTTWDCNSHINRPHANKLLKDYEVDVEASLKYFEDFGGYCDCEIIFNVALRQRQEGF